NSTRQLKLGTAARLMVQVSILWVWQKTRSPLTSRQRSRKLIKAGGLTPQQEAAAQAGIRGIEILSRATKDTRELARMFWQSNKAVVALLSAVNRRTFLAAARSATLT